MRLFRGELRPFNRRIRIAVALLALALLLVAIAILAAPWWIDSDAAKREIAHRIDRATGARLHVQRIDLRWFPLPRVTLDGVRYAAPGGSVDIGQAVVELDRWALLVGQVRPARIRLTGARATIALPAPEGASSGFPPPGADAALRALLEKLAAAAAGLQLSIADGALTLRAAGRAPILFSDLHASLKIAADGLQGDAAFASPYWQRAQLDFTLRGGSLDGSGSIRLIGLRTGRLGELLPDPQAWPVVEGDAVARVDWHMQGLSQLRLQATAAAPRIVLQRAGARHAFDGVVAAGSYTLDNGIARGAIERLYVRAPHLLAGATLTVASGKPLQLTAYADGVDLPAAQRALRDLAPELQWPAGADVDAGTLSALALHSSAARFDQLFDPASLHAEAAFDGLAIELAQPRLRLAAVSGRARLDGGQVDLQTLTARIGRSVVRDARATIDLSQPALPIHARATIAVDLADLLRIARPLLAGTAMRAPLDALQMLDGHALTDITLAYAPKALQARIDAHDLDVRVRHRGFALPVTLTQGRIVYADRTVTAQGLGGTVGASRFDALDADIALEKPHRFAIASLRGRIAVDELLAALAARPDMKPALSAIGPASGAIAIGALRARGSVGEIANTRFDLRLSPEHFAITPPAIGTELRLDGGQIALTPQRIDASDVSATIVDSTLQLSAKANDYRGGVSSVEASVKGKIGDATLGWIYRRWPVPAAARIHGPLQIATAQLAWRRGATLSLSGSAEIAGTVTASIAASSGDNTFRLERLTLRDAASDASLGGSFERGRLSTWFKGRLAGSTLSALLEQPPFGAGRLQGDMRVALQADKPLDATAEGRLQGESIALPRTLPLPLDIERFALAASGSRVTVDNAVVVSGTDRARISGSVERSAEHFRVDASLDAEHIGLPATLWHTADSEAEAQANKGLLQRLPVSGRIAVNVRQLDIGATAIAPLIANASLKEGRLDVGIAEAALCGVTLSGNVDGNMRDIRFNATLSARNADLAESIPCLTKQQVAGSGAFDLDAAFSAQGPPDTLRDRLSGTFRIEARDGLIERFETLNRLLGVINVTEAARGEKLDLSARGLPYRLASASGRISGSQVRIEQSLLDAPTLRVSASGTVDYRSDALSMNVLVAPLQTVNALLRYVPLLGRIFGVGVVAIPVQVSGTLRDPVIVPLGPSAVATRLLEVLSNTLKLPVDVLREVAPADSGSAR